MKCDVLRGWLATGRRADTLPYRRSCTGAVHEARHESQHRAGRVETVSGQLDGQIAIVTGGSGGIGTGLCRALAANGATVVVVDLDGDGAVRVAGEITAAGGSAEGRRVDVTSPAEVTALVQAVAARY